MIKIRRVNWNIIEKFPNLVILETLLVSKHRHDQNEGGVLNQYRRHCFELNQLDRKNLCFNNKRHVYQDIKSYWIDKIMIFIKQTTKDYEISILSYCWGQLQNGNPQIRKTESSIYLGIKTQIQTWKGFGFSMFF